MTQFIPAFIVHGGAWDIPDAEIPSHLNGCRIAAEIGWSILQRGGSALDAVETAIRSLEDDPAFDAGQGAWLNSAGEVELDAIIMDGVTLNNGAVAAVQHVRNPISVARLVMERTAHSLLTGLGAEHFAQAQGIPLCDESELLTGQELERWKAIKAQKDFKVEVAFGGPPHGTVGAVARDVHGHIAAGTSTGGTPNKLQGRVGDSPLIGCGCYADNLSAGASATGWGESIMKVVLCKAACDYIALGQSAQAAAEKAIGVLADRAQGLGGLIVIDRSGQIGVAFNTPRMARAWIEDGQVSAAVERQP
ncbi:beta-aspartyl-peptidase (threonine type) [Thermoflexales bacterium]|nr:beta-aspartyl-peptidase (threonine type) [Thermoflexales bacterium]